MDYKETKKRHHQISGLILNNEILVAIKELFDFANNTKKQYHQIQIEKIKDTYSNILKHSFSGIDDPERDKVYSYVQKSLLELNDKIKECLLTETSDLTIYKMKWSLEKELENQSDEAYSLINNLTFDKELDNILKENNIDLSKVNSDDTKIVSRQEALKELFNFLWLTDSYKEIENKIIDSICFSEKIPWHDKSLIVSALTLSLLRFFDTKKFTALLNFYHTGQNQVWQRALVGIVLALYKYDERINLYPELEKQMLKLSKVDEIDKQFETVLIQIFKSKETEKITKRWEEEILPEMMKMQPKIEENLDLENILPDKFLEDKNPDWEKVFEDSPDLLDKLQNFSEMQIEGSDVFMSAFSKLKHFPFFNEISNWFTPFHKENEYIDLIIEKEETNLQAFVEQLEKSFHMCNSDKYSFCLNLQMIPESHKSMMMEMFNEEMKSMEEIAKDENLLNQFAITKSIITQYLQDLYRFYKLHPNKNEFSDIFKWNFDVQYSDFFNKIITNKQVIRNIAEFLLENEHYDKAVEIFKIIENTEESNIELFEKIGYCYQRLGQYKDALTYYKHAELLDENKAWIIKKIALCHRYLNEHKKALEYYKEAEKLDPENLYIQAYIGHTLIRLENYDDALKYYFKVEYLAPSNEKIQRPIAWISFVTGKFDSAIKYYKKILDKNVTGFDLIHLGHSYWCSKEIQKAIETYKKALEYFKGDFQKFNQSFVEDINYLTKHEISKLDINLMKDYILNSMNLN
ncbi:MAG: tetratricopeptide repeat protein [Bacteroidales bacterium]|nr:tetratricopeptide repeat protein [Bacteroidales bacterium]